MSEKEFDDMRGAMPLRAMYAGIPECYRLEVFQHLMQQEIKRGRRYADFFTFLIVAPDPVNGVGYGGEGRKADRLLALLVENIREELRDTDFIGRYGNHLAVILLHSTTEETRAVAERLRERVRRFIFPSEVHPGRSPLTVSLGGACFPTHGHDVPSLLQSALQSLRQARQAGGDRAIMFPDLGPGA